ncbi:P-loop containing nucleoside triphosphate hydrolase protein [Immersiella caudata]|uniref:P-loop containing nucleoside triphosphate hydrolase protein n=1 Tax=Immersiella caudata TaxID=314043 RepID=A0AA39WLF6_9PEZI|nr:P-loop containing nucleoside triphosphate hydrolase protein [Immersiella caudata]
MVLRPSLGLETIPESPTVSRPRPVPVPFLGLESTYDPGAAHETYKIAVIGDAGVGKTSLISQFLNGTSPESYSPTIEDWNICPAIIGGRNCSLHILDTGGDEACSSILMDDWIRAVDGFMVVYAIERRRSYTESGRLYRIVSQQQRSRRAVESRTATFPAAVLIGLRMDHPRDREVSFQEARARAGELGTEHLEFSMAPGEVDEVRLRESFGIIIRLIQRQRAGQHLGATAIS